MRLCVTQIPDTESPKFITLGRGYPDTLQVFRMPASKYWYVGMYLSSRGRFVKKSTKCEKLNDAKVVAADWYEDRIVEKRTHHASSGMSFAIYSEKFQETQKREIRRGNLSQDMLDEDRRKLEKDVIPYLGSHSVRKVDYNLVDRFIDDLVSDRKLSPSSLKKYVVLIRKVLKEAERDGVISAIPNLPTIKSREKPRPWFTPEQYKRLLSSCRDLRDNPPKNGYGAGSGDGTEFDFEELYDFIVFMIHTFLRPSEWKYLQNKHIEVMETNGQKQLVISVPNAKTKKSKGLSDSTSTEIAADIYLKKILKRHDEENDYLFFNDIKDRDRWVQDRLSRVFRIVCDAADLDTDTHGQKHTTYSLRHSALCFQILKTNGTDLFSLAKNARTSVEMLEKFYLSHLSSRMPEFSSSLLTARVLDTK
jgi:integrase